MKSPDSPLKCLLVSPEFPTGSFWNYKDAVEVIGAKTPALPLGLITVAALLPQQWTFRLVDLNCGPMPEDALAWADLVAVGGMLPQQTTMLAVIRSARAQGKFVVVGGPDPTSQPEIYREADARVLDEGEVTIPAWLESWRAGVANGVFRSAEKPDMTTTPVPRYDLLKLADYDLLGLQISRGCPFNCEFCDIIELFGRKPRIKTPAQVIRELDTILATGWRGGVNVVDDNFIGNKRYIRREILPALSKWNKDHRRPFYFATEASMNLADDEPMMLEMADAGFRILFTGIETPDPELLLQAQKSQNTVRPIQDRIRRMLASGLLPTAGFILGFDGEKSGMDQVMIKCIEELPVTMAMVGLLVALPNTQLERRLRKEGRLLTFDGKPIDPAEGKATADLSISLVEVTDNTTAGLNFITKRDRGEILDEYQRIIAYIYSPKVYMDRVLRQVGLLQTKVIRIPHVWEAWREVQGFFRISWRMTKDPAVRKLYWRNVYKTLLMGPNSFDTAMRLMSMFLHFAKQRDLVLEKSERIRGIGKDLVPIPQSTDAA